MSIQMICDHGVPYLRCDECARLEALEAAEAKADQATFAALVEVARGFDAYVISKLKTDDARTNARKFGEAVRALANLRALNPKLLEDGR